MLRPTLLCAALIVLPGVSSAAQAPVDGAAVDWARILEHAQRAASAYDSDDAIRQRYRGGSRLLITTLPKLDVRAFVEIDTDRRLQWIVVRGTSNLENVKLDAECAKDVVASLGVPVHKGFYEAAQGVYAFARPALQPGFETRVTGHSLGGAVAVIVAMMLHNEGIELSSGVTFGQPKVTTAAGVDRYRDLPLLRVVNSGDPIPLLPPVTFLTVWHGIYRHFGAEIWVKNDSSFERFSEHQAERGDVSSFWLQLGREDPLDHPISRYLARLRPLVSLVSGGRRDPPP